MVFSTPKTERPYIYHGILDVYLPYILERGIPAYAPIYRDFHPAARESEARPRTNGARPVVIEIAFKPSELTPEVGGKFYSDILKNKAAALPVPIPPHWIRSIWLKGELGSKPKKSEIHFRIVFLAWETPYPLPPKEAYASNDEVFTALIRWRQKMVVS